MIATRQKVTPPELAQRWGIDPHKVVGWIRSGELRAIDAATHAGGRPRYLIDERDIELFELRRSTAPAPRPTQRRAKNEAITEYF